MIASLVLDVFEADLTDRFYYVPIGAILALCLVDERRSPDDPDERGGRDRPRPPVSLAPPRRVAAIGAATVTSARVLGYNIKRVAQTPRTFRNWPTLLTSLAGEKLHRGAPTLTFVTRSGIRLRCPNVPGARLPMYEQFADDNYRADWVLGPRQRSAADPRRRGARRRVRHQCGRRPTGRPGRVLRTVAEHRRVPARQRRPRTGWTTGSRCTRRRSPATAGTAELDDNSSGSVHNGLVGDAGRLVDGDDSAGQPARRPGQDRHLRRRGRGRRPVRRGEDGLRGRRIRPGLRLGQAALGAGAAGRAGVPPGRRRVVGELRAWFEGVGLRVVRDEIDPQAPGLGLAWLERTAA